MVGEQGASELGFPLRTADKLGFQSLLHARRFEQLCEYMTELQSAFEEDPAKERWPYDALESFNIVTPATSQLLDAWIEATPDCFAAHAARGVHRYALGSAQRGAAWAGQTPAHRFAAMSRSYAAGRRDLERALELRPRLAAASSFLMQIHGGNGDAAASRAAYEAAVERCPDCVILRFSYLRAIRPEWGGGGGELERYVRSIDTSHPPLRAFSGYLAYERCYQLRRERRAEEALAACDGAIASAPYWRFYFERGRARRSHGDLPGALADLEEALRRRPMNAGALLETVYALLALDRTRDAAEQLRVLAHLLPDDPRVLRLGQRVAPSMAAELMAAQREGRQEDAATLARLMQDIVPRAQPPASPTQP